MNQHKPPTFLVMRDGKIPKGAVWANNFRRAGWLGYDIAVSCGFKNITLGHITNPARLGRWIAVEWNFLHSFDGET